MHTSFESLFSWAHDAQWQNFPTSPRALGELTGNDKSPLLTLAFETCRDIVSAIGYRRGEQADGALCACTAALCQRETGYGTRSACAYRHCRYAPCRNG